MYHITYERKPYDSDKVLGIVKGTGRHYNKFIVLREGDGKHKIKINDNEHIEPVLSDFMSRGFIWGETGSGKSTLVKLLLKNSKEPAYIISAKKHNTDFKDITDVKNIDVAKLIEHPIKNLKDWKHSTFVYDDIQWPNKIIDKKISRQRDFMLNLGRSYHINVLCTSWKMTQNAYPQLQSQFFGFFPNGDVLHLKKYLQNRGKTKDEIDRIINQKFTRWAILVKQPLIIITQNKIEML